jgi:hypothetical protein
MIDRLDAVAVWVAQEGGVVTVMIVGAKAQRTVAGSALGEPRRMQGVDRFAARGAEAPVPVVRYQLRPAAWEDREPTCTRV